MKFRFVECRSGDVEVDRSRILCNHDLAFNKGVPVKKWKKTGLMLLIAIAPKT